jgi:hypothetical protein
MLHLLSARVGGGRAALRCCSGAGVRAAGCCALRCWPSVAGCREGTGGGLVRRGSAMTGALPYTTTTHTTHHTHTHHTPHTQHTTHNTQHTTHNTQHTPHTQHTTHNTQHTTHNTQHTTHNTHHALHRRCCSWAAWRRRHPPSPDWCAASTTSTSPLAGSWGCAPSQCATRRCAAWRRCARGRAAAGGALPWGGRGLLLGQLPVGLWLRSLAAARAAAGGGPKPCRLAPTLCPLLPPRARAGGSGAGPAGRCAAGVRGHRGQGAGGAVRGLPAWCWLCLPACLPACLLARLMAQLDAEAWGLGLGLLGAAALGAACGRQRPQPSTTAAQRQARARAHASPPPPHPRHPRLSPTPGTT